MHALAATTAAAALPCRAARSLPQQGGTAGRLFRRQAAPLQRRRPPRAARCSISAAQKKVFTSFADMIQQSPEPVLVEFYATWCGPCQMMGQVMDEVAPALRDRVRFVKVDSDKYGGLASQFSVGALPTLILFKNGQPVDRMEGVVMAGDLRARLERQL